MRVGIIGAGIAGLAAARELKLAGHEPTVFEKSNGLGGRVATRRMGAYTFDTGATSIAPRGLAIEDVMLRQLSSDDLVEVKLPIFTHEMGRISAGSPNRNLSTRYVYRPGNTALPKLLAAGLDIQLGAQIAGLSKVGERYSMSGQEWDAVIITAPAPQTATLLETVGEKRALGTVRYRACLSILLSYEAELTDPHFHALIDPEQRSPLAWLSLESVKSPGRAPAGCTAMVAQMGATFSYENYDASDDSVADEAIVGIERLFGARFEKPSGFQVKRWRYSQPESIVQFDVANPAGTRLLIASDCLTGPRVELAFDAGIQAARRLIESK